MNHHDLSGRTSDFPSTSTTSETPMIPALLGDLLKRPQLEEAIAIVNAAGADVQWQIIDEPVLSDQGEVNAEVIALIEEAQVAFMAPHRAQEGAGKLSPIVKLRQRLDLFAGVRYIRHLKGLESRYQDLDFVIIRENTEGVYAGLEHIVHPGVVESIKVVTRRASARIARFAYQLAQAQRRASVALIHKANIMKRSDGLFLQAASEVGARFADDENAPIETRSLIVDNACMQLVMRPEQFDVIVCGNLYGDILSDLSAGLVGGSAATWGEDHGDDQALFTVAQGQAFTRAEEGSSALLSLLMPLIALLRHIGQGQVSDRVLSAVERTLSRGVSPHHPELSDLLSAQLTRG